MRKALATVVVLCLSIFPRFAAAQGNMAAWGANNAGILGGGALGDGTTTDRPTPVGVVGAGGVGSLADVVAMTGAELRTLALKSDGTVWVWGASQNGPYLGAGAVNFTMTPLQVLGPAGVGVLDHVVAIAAGYGHHLALKDDGTLWAWGLNSNGQLGNGFGGAGQDQQFPVQVVGPGGAGFLTGIVAIDAGQGHSLAVKSDGTVWAWGYNVQGTVGDGTGIERHVPVQVPGLTNMIAVSAGNGVHSVALKSDGTVYHWGYNGLTVPDHIFRYSPAQVSIGLSPLTGIVKIAAGSGHTLALDGNGTVWTWGGNQYGQLGNGLMGSGSDVATPVGSLSTVNAIGAGKFFSLVVTSAGAVMAWGDNVSGQVGTGGTGSPVTAPIQVSDPNNLLVDVAAVSGGGSHSLALIAASPSTDEAPTITSTNTTTFVAGGAGAFTVTTTGSPVPELQVTGALPANVTFVDNGDGTGTLGGTPQAGTSGSYPLTITASNGVPSDFVQSFTLTVIQAPAITSASATTFTIGVVDAFAVTTSGSPTAALSHTAGSLPSGITFVDNGDGTGTLGGTPGVGTAGSYPITLTASNGVAPDAVQSFTLTVEAPAANVADLLEQNVKFDRQDRNANPGDTIDIEDTVKNAGPAAAGPSTTRYYLADDRQTIAGALLLGMRSVPALTAAGNSSSSKGSVTLTIPLSTAPGRHFVFACADDLNQVTETNDLNNCRASPPLKIK